MSLLEIKIKCTFTGLILFLVLCTRKTDARKFAEKRQFQTNYDAAQKGSVVNEDASHGVISRNKGSPLDGDNGHEDVKNKGKPPKEMKPSTVSKTGRLVNRFHWLLQVDGLNVSSTRDSDSSAGKINVTSIGKDLVEIQGIKSDSFVCMNSQSGDIFGSKSRTANCIFKENVEENFHSTFRLNVSSAEWYLGIDKQGKFLKKNTLKPDFATLFQLIS